MMQDTEDHGPDAAAATAPCDAPMQATPFARFVAPARGRAQLWWLVAGALLALAVYVGWVILAGGAVVLVAGPEAAGRILAGLATPDRPAETLLLLATFVGLAAGPAIAVRLLHRRPARSLVGPLRAALRDFGVAAATVAAVYGIGLGLGLAGAAPGDLRPNLVPEVWALLLLPGLAALVVQTGAEELFFRGYVQQQLAARFASPVVWGVLPALLFGAVHWDPAMGAAAVPVIVSATVFGLVAADLTRATGTIGAAWGAHFANNVAAVLVVATPGTITGLARYVTPYGVGDAAAMLRALPVDIGLLIAVWALLRLTLRRLPR